jgi:hypothetical protein
LPCGRENFTEIVRGKVFEEGGWSKDTPGHIRFFRPLHEVLFDFVFEDEVRDWRGIMNRLFTTTVYGAVDEELDALFDRLIYQCDTLAALVIIFGIGCLFIIYC